MRKFLSIFLILILLLTGCTAQTADPAAPAETAEEPQAEQTAPAPAQEGAASTETALPAAEAVDPGYSDRDRSGTWDEDDVVARIALNGSAADVQGEGAAFADGILTVTAEGVYVLTGELDGSITVDAGEGDKVQLVLQDAAVRSADGPAIRILSADKVFLTVPEGSAASLSDSAAYTLPEGEDEPNACLYSKADLTLNGAGSLTVTGNYRHAVNSKDDLIITCGALTVTAVEDGLRGKDGVGIDAGEISVTCGGDGVHSSGDEEKPEKGWISLDGGTLSVNSGSDGVQAATILQLRGGSVSLTTGGGAGEAAAVTDSFGDFGKGGGKNWFGTLPEAPADGTLPEDPTGGEKPDRAMDGAVPDMPEGGTTPEMPADDAFTRGGAKPDGFAQQGAADADDTEGATSAKGLKSDGSLLVTGGALQADCADDALHAAGDIRILGGELTLSTGDDGVHADGAVSIEAGTLTVSQSYEGIEGTTVEISGGQVDVTSSDDGLNAASGTAMGMEAEQGVSITLSGGSVHIDAGGDGIDSNGALTVSGGTIVVDGPTNSGNGALDYASSAVITGGSVAAMGAQQMAAGFGSGSTQCSAMVTFSQAVSAGARMALLDASGTELMAWTVGKSATSAVLSCPGMAEGENYTVTADGQTVATFTASLPTGSTGFGGGRGGMGGFGGDRTGGKDAMRGQKPTDGAQGGDPAEATPVPDGTTGQA